MAIRATDITFEAGLLRHAASLAIVRAAWLEQNGHIEEGFAIRRAVARCGARVRVDSTTVIDSFTGEAMAAIARSRPAGAPSFSRVAGLTGDQRTARSMARYESYLTTIGHPGEIAWVEHEAAARTSIKRLVGKALNDSPTSMPVFMRLMLFWLAAAFLLGSSFLVLLTGGFAALTNRSSMVMRRLPLTIAAFMAFGLLYLSFGTFGIGGLAQMAAQSSSQPPPILIWQRLLATVLGCAVPLTMALTFAIRSRIRRVPVAASIVQGFVANAVPVVTVLLLLFIGLIANISALESRSLRTLASLAQSEGRTYADAEHQVWPTFGPEMPSGGSK